MQTIIRRVLFFQRAQPGNAQQSSGAAALGDGSFIRVERGVSPSAAGGTNEDFSESAREFSYISTQSITLKR